MFSTSRSSVPMKVKVQFCFFNFSMRFLIIFKSYSSLQFSSPSVMMVTSLVFDNAHTATLIYYQKIEYSFHNLFLLFILIVQHILFHILIHIPFHQEEGTSLLLSCFLIASLSLKRKIRGEN